MALSACHKDRNLIQDNKGYLQEINFSKNNHYLDSFTALGLECHILQYLLLKYPTCVVTDQQRGKKTNLAS